MICKKVLFVFLMVFVSFAFAGESPYNPNQNLTKYLFCQVYKPENSPAVYFSNTFPGNPNKLYPVQKSYVEFLEKKYSYKAPPGMDEFHMPVRCYGLNTQVLADQQKAINEEQEKYSAHEIIETGWTYDSTKSGKQESTPVADTGPSSSASMTQDDKLDSFTLATLQQDPRAARLSPMDRQFVTSEAVKAKSYCAKDAQMSHVLDCNCFVHTLFDYRIAHASGPIQTTIFPPLASVLEQKDFSCSKCVDQKRLAQWSDAKTRTPLACEKH